MTDQNSQFFAILTAVGEAKQANAAALGTSWTFAQMAVGDANGTDPIPSRTQTKLINERRRAPLNQVKVDPANASVIIAEQIIPESVGGWWVRELALYDADGDMVAVANCAPTFKPLLTQGSGRTQVIRINLIVSSTANIELKIDPSVVLATREYVDTVIVEALSKLDYKHSVLAATTANIVLSGIQTIDGELLSAGARVLVKDQAQAKENGIYVVPAAGAWKRAQDADTSVEVTPGLFVSVEKGTVNGDSVWQLVTDAPIVLGTTALAFEMVAGRTGVSAGAYTKVTVDKYGRVIAGTTPTTLAGHGITDTYTKDEIATMIAQASALPVGSIIGFPVDKVAPGFLELDGSVKSAAAYPDLATFLGGAFNKGDEGAGNFRLPESRGEFLRGWDHGRGIDAGRAIGSYQADELKSHDHTVTNTGTGGTDQTLWLYGDPGALPITNPGVKTNATGGTETRPRNLAVMWCIKAWNAPINQGSIDIAALAPLAAQATEINQGTAKIATQAQVDAGADDATIITPKKLKFGLTIIKGASSWAVELPSWLGLLKLQWGVHAAQTGDTETSVTFPIGFDAVPTCVSMLTHEGDTLVNSSTVTQGRKMTTTGFLSRRDDIGSISTFSGAVSIRWFAIGF
ncbi:phage tail-collar fiber domain-containing protein [Pseudomonas marginalis]|uniref:phage tail-collar fiber domain-containing protein n=1 Tax=Pseudomonas marginalis TaxID=298 RepID=UPI0034D4354E